MRAIRDYEKIEECQISVKNTYDVAKNIYGFLMSAKDKMDEDTYRTLTHDVMIIINANFCVSTSNANSISASGI